MNHNDKLIEGLACSLSTTADSTTFNSCLNKLC